MGIVRGISLAVPFGALICAACTPSVYYYQRSVVGISAAASTASGGGHLMVGANRQIVPVIQSANGSANGEAMSFIGCTETEIKDIFNVSVTDYTATGAAADAIARAGVNQDLEACFGAASTPPPSPPAPAAPGAAPTPAAPSGASAPAGAPASGGPAQ